MIASLLSVLFLCACRRSEPWNVLIVTLDTTRADYLGSYGRSTARTPNLDRLAAEGVLFRHAVSVAPVTLPSHSSIFTGTYPTVHGVRDNGLFQLPEASTTLAEVFQQAGYSTAAAIGAYPLVRRFGISQGFDLYDDDVTVDVEDLRGQKQPAGGRLFFDERPAVQVNDAILPWLRAHHQRPFFAWIHYWDAHHPHMPPAPYNQLFGHDLYQGEIAYVDESLGAVLRTLEELGVADRTLIVVVGDHGEGRGEHKEDTHSMLAYDSTLHVPLIMRMPGSKGGREIVGRVSTVDIFPTVLDLVGLDDRKPAEVQGRSLAQLIQGSNSAEDSSRRMVHYAEALSPRLSFGWGELRALYEGNYKYIHGPRPELFDLDSDPSETRNLVLERPSEADRLSRNLERFLSRQPPSLALDAVKDDDPEARSRLAALGYISGGGDAPSSIEETLRQDGLAPQDRVVDVNLQSHVKQLINTGDFLGARDAAEALLSRDPDNGFYRGLLVTAWIGLQRPEAAADVIEASAVLSEQSEAVYLQAARQLFVAGAPQRALAIVERMATESETAAVRYLLAEMYHELGDLERYEAELRLALARDPRHHPTRLSLAIRLAQRREYAEAEALLASLLRDGPLNDRYHFNYAALLIDAGEISRQDEALLHLERAAELNPAYCRAHLELLRLRVNRGDRAEARRAARMIESSCRDTLIREQADALTAELGQGAGA